jgi:hypothetical protein
MAKFGWVIGLAAATATAMSYDYNGTPTSSLIELQSGPQIDSRISQGWRPTSIEIESAVANLVLYRVSYVRNTGTHFQQVRFANNQTPQTINNIRAAGWRVEDIAYVSPNRLSAILIRNVTNPRTTNYFWGWTSSQISSYASSWQGRLIDLDRYILNGATRYSGVFIKNTGASASAWGWHPGFTWDQVRNWATANNMRVIDLDRHSSGVYAVVFVRRQSNQRYIYFGNRTLGEMLDLLGNYGMRAQTVSMTATGGQNRYSGTAVNNVNAETARLANLGIDDHNGIHGFWLKQVGGTVLVNLHGTRLFHPSSTNKVMSHFRAVFSTPSNQLNTRMIGNLPMTSVLSAMMWNSNNSMANRCLDVLGVANIEATCRNPGGMSASSRILNRYGTGGPYNNNPYSVNTLDDFGRLYEHIQLGASLGATKVNYLRTNMLNQGRSGLFNTVINQESTALGVSASRLSAYRSQLRFIFKAGNNSKDGINGYWSVAGVITLPYRQTNGTVLLRSYVFGHFVNHSTVDYDNGFAHTEELLRSVIRASLNTYR